MIIAASSFSASKLVIAMYLAMVLFASLAFASEYLPVSTAFGLEKHTNMRTSLSLSKNPPTARKDPAFAPADVSRFQQSGSSRLLKIRGGAISVADVSPTELHSTASSLINAVVMAEIAPPWVKFCSAVAPYSSLVFCLAPLSTIQRIEKNKSVGDLPLLPYTSLLANCFLWFLYGVLRAEAKVWSCNGAGFLLGCYYFRTFCKYSPESSPTLPGTRSNHLGAVLTIIGSAVMLAFRLPAQDAASWIGLAGVVLCIGTFASPLVALSTVIEKRSAESIPMLSAVASALSCFSWSVCGLLEMHDVNIYLPSLLGLACAAAQVGLKLVLRNGPARRPKFGGLVWGR